jgi:non-ribosomal peptide synthetase component E (peptide arylation enzyme)
LRDTANSYRCGFWRRESIKVCKVEGEGFDPGSQVHVSRSSDVSSANATKVNESAEAIASGNNLNNSAQSGRDHRDAVHLRRSASGICKRKRNTGLLAKIDISHFMLLLSRCLDENCHCGVVFCFETATPIRIVN